MVTVKKGHVSLSIFVKKLVEMKEVIYLCIYCSTFVNKESCHDYSRNHARILKVDSSIKHIVIKNFVIFVKNISKEKFRINFQHENTASLTRSTQRLVVFLEIQTCWKACTKQLDRFFKNKFQLKEKYRTKQSDYKLFSKKL